MLTAKEDFLTKPEVDISDPVMVPFFKKIQGNILKGHGRDHAVLILLRFRGEHPTRARKHLAAFAKTHVTDFYRQLWERERFKRNQVPGNTFGSVFITKKGYEFLEPGKDLLADDAFKEGMRDSKAVNDPADGVEHWHRKDIHAMLLLADDDTARLNEAAKGVLDEFMKIADILHVEYGDAIRNANGDGLEHNGYVDGVSQPLFLLDEMEAYRKYHNAKDNDKLKFNPAAAPDLVLIEDPYATAGEGHYGSYFVFRKLEQNVRKFKHDEGNIGDVLYKKDKEQAERAGAMLVGRFEDGTPIQVQEEDHLIGSGAFNNFNYKEGETNTAGGICPHFAHIRKVNPRVNDQFDEHAIARRGIPFGFRNVSTEREENNIYQHPEKGVGLLFMCFQASIMNQFVFLQQKANNIDSHIPDDGVDPVIGQGERKKYSFPGDKDTDPKAAPDHHFSQKTFFRGGEYFFAPSMHYLELLKDG